MSPAGAGPLGSSNTQHTSVEKMEGGTSSQVTVTSSQYVSGNAVSVHTTTAQGRDKSRGDRACRNSKYTELGGSQVNLSTQGNKHGGAGGVADCEPGAGQKAGKMALT